MPAANGDGEVDEIFPSNNSALNDVGRVFNTLFFRNTFNTSGLVYSDLGGSGQIVRTGQAPPDGNGNITSFGNFAVSAEGPGAIIANLNGTSGGATDNQVLLEFEIDESLVVAISERMRRGDPAPSGGTNKLQNCSFVDINDGGGVVVSGLLNGTSLGTIDDGVILRQISGQPSQEILRENGSTPDLNGVWDTFAIPNILNASSLVFHSNLRSTTGGTADNTALIGINIAGAPQIIIRKGVTVIPELGGALVIDHGTSTPAVNEAGDVAVRLAVSGGTATSGDDTGIWRLLVFDPVPDRPIFREGQTLPSGKVVGNLSSSVRPLIADGGQVAAVLPTTDLGSLLAISDLTEVVELITTGDLIGGAAITNIVQPVAGPAGGREMLNKHGQISAIVELAGNDYATVVLTPDLRWRGAGIGMWHSSGDFTLGLVPAFPHNVTLDLPGADDPLDWVEIDGPTADTTVWSLALGDVGSAKLDLDATGRVTVQEKLSLKYNSILDIPAGAYLSAGTVEANDESDIFLRGKLDAGHILINALAVFNATFDSEVTTDSMTNYGTLDGAGTLIGELYSYGVIRVGFSPGILSIVGDATLGAGNHLIMEIGGLVPGTEHDQLDVSGRLTLGGVLELSLIDGFVPQPGDSLNLLAFGSLVGDFDDVVLPALGPGLEWDEAALANGGVISVVPEPKSSLLALGAMLGLMAVHRATRRSDGRGERA
jgi:hypothetical protein